jgi:lysophospholipase L1-like esterase
MKNWLKISLLALGLLVAGLQPTHANDAYLTRADCLAGGWTLPGTWNNTDNDVEIVGESGAAVAGNSSNGGNGGGGGGYAHYHNITLTGPTIACQIGAGGSATDSFLVNASTMLSHGGSLTSGGAISAIGSPASTFKGGDGGLGCTGGAGGGQRGGGGGGGAAGPSGDGKAGASCTGGVSNSGGGGAADNGFAGTVSNGGNNSNGTDGGAGGSAGVDGTAGAPRLNFGGAGGGGSASFNKGGNGAIGEEWDSTHGSGGGGGGGSGSGSGTTANVGGDGGNYGGGPGGGGSSATGSAVPAGNPTAGVIHIRWTPSGNASDFIITNGQAVLAPGQTSIAFTIADNGTVVGSTQSCTTSDASQGGTFAPSTPSISVGGTSTTFTYTASSSIALGTTVTLTVTCTGGVVASHNATVVIGVSVFGAAGDSITYGLNATTQTGQGAISLSKSDYLSWFLYYVGVLPKGPYTAAGNGQGLSGSAMATSGGCSAWQGSSLSAAQTAWDAIGIQFVTIMLATNDTRDDCVPSNATFLSAVNSLTAAIHAHYPLAKILIMPPPWQDTSATSFPPLHYSTASRGRLNGTSDGAPAYNYDAQLLAAADNVYKFTCTTAMQNFFKTNGFAAGYLSSDGVHPTDAGHKAIGAFFYECYRQKFYPDANGTGTSGGSIIGANDNVRRWYASNDDAERVLRDIKYRMLLAAN